MEEFDLEKLHAKLAPFYTDGKLNKWPGKLHLRMLALVKIADSFRMDKEYTEKEVNAIIKEKILFNDIENIRRELIDYKFLERLRDGSKYWVNKNWKEKHKLYIG